MIVNCYTGDFNARNITHLKPVFIAHVRYNMAVFFYILAYTVSIVEDQFKVTGIRLLTARPANVG